MREVEQDSRKDLYHEPNIQGLKLRDIRYADDTALLSTTTEGLHQLIHSVKEHSENKGLFLNIKKTKIVDTDRCKKTSDIIVDGETEKPKRGRCLDGWFGRQRPHRHARMSEWVSEWVRLGYIGYI